MADIRQAMQAKSDQLNSVDILGFEPIIRIREVRVNINAPSQKIWIYFDGDNNRPWKASLGMYRIISLAWGFESDNWIGKSIKLFVEPTVKYGGAEVGGIQIREMSDIPTKGITSTLVINNKKRVPFKVGFLKIELPVFDDEKFNKAFPTMQAQMESGEKTLQQVIARCQQLGGALTPEQLKRLEDAAPIEDGE